MRSSIKCLMAGSVLLAGSSMVSAEELMKPFVLAYKTTGDVAAVAEEVKGKLTAAGFEIAGSYSPFETASIIAVTSDEIKKAAAASEFGGYAAAQRVSVTKVGDEVQVSYTNPTYMQSAYRMDGDLSGATAKLKATLGGIEEYGPSDGLSEKKLRKYQYMFGMEYFTDPSELAKYDSYDNAVKAVEQGITAGKGGVNKVYRIDIPGKNETVFGVALTDGCSSDQFIMKEIDFKPLRSTGHLPYEILVSDNKVYALYARFRIAINFPDLAMMGANSFVNIMCAPNAIEGALEQAASGSI